MEGGMDGGKGRDDTEFYTRTLDGGRDRGRKGEAECLHILSLRGAGEREPDAGTDVSDCQDVEQELESSGIGH